MFKFNVDRKCDLMGKCFHFIATNPILRNMGHCWSICEILLKFILDHQLNLVLKLFTFSVDITEILKNLLLWEMGLRETA